MEGINLDGCDICAENHDTLECPHLVGEGAVEDEDPNALNLSRARLSLPHYLEYLECEDGMCQIVTKTTIKAKTKLGPFEARKTRQILEIENAFILKIFLKDSTALTLDTTDEEECNWLCLISAARTPEEQNCLVVQLGLDIYYMTMCNIASNTPLKVWYAPHYARKLGKSPQPDGSSIILLGCVLSQQIAPVLMVQYDNSPHKFMQVEQVDETLEESKEEGASSENIEKAAVYKCNLCETCLPSEYALQLHQATHAGSSTGDLDVIQTALAMSESMVDSVNEIASPRVDKIYHSAEDEIHACVRCPQMFKTMQELAIHVKDHLAEETPKRPKGRHRKWPLVIQPNELVSEGSQQSPAAGPAEPSNKLKKYVALQRVKKETAASDYEVESEVDIHNATHVPNVPNKTIIRTRRQAAHEGASSIPVIVLDSEDSMSSEPSKKGAEKDNVAQNESVTSQSDDTQNNDRTNGVASATKTTPKSGQEPVKRGRGRPRKYPKVDKSPSIDSVDVPDESSADVRMAERQNSSAAVVPRKRGRPRKYPLPQTKVAKLTEGDIGENKKVYDEEDKTTVTDESVEEAVAADNNNDGDNSVNDDCSRDIMTTTEDNDLQTTLNSETATVETVESTNNSHNDETTAIEITGDNNYAQGNTQDINDTPEITTTADVCDLSQPESQITEQETPEITDASLKVTSVKVRVEQTKSREVKPKAERLHRVVQRCNMDVNSAGAIEYSCKECKAAYLSLVDFEDHLKEHVGEYVCHQCKKTFKRMDLLCYHQCRAVVNAKKVDVYTCKVCGKVFDKLKGLTRHMQGHLGKFRCDKCNKVFARKDTFDRHSCGSKKTSDPSLVEKHVCEFCGASFNKRKYLLRHMAMHTGEFACKVCGREFARKESLMQHQLKCDPDVMSQEGHTIFRCKLCNRVFAKEVSLQNHMMLHTEDHKCQVCGKCFASHFSLVKHNCVGESEVVMDGENATTLFKCTKCEKSFTKHLYLKRHMDMHNGQYSCIFCNESYSKKDDLNKHLIDCTAMIQLSAKGRVECPACMEAFDDKDEFRMHYEIHTHPYMCEICQKRFIRKANLDTHECTPWDEDPVSCEVCGKLFQHPKFLQRHRVVHAEAKFKCVVCARRFLTMEQLERHAELCPDAHKPKKRSWKKRERRIGAKQEDQYICPTCGKSYVSVSNLNKHILTHGEKREECHLCQKMFHLKVNLKEHLRMVHTVEKKFECKYCGKKMKSRNSIYGHMRQFHQNTLLVYQCEMCHRSFRQKGNLKKHVLMHSLEKFYSCSRCDRKFKYSEQLRRHERWHEQGYTHCCNHCSKKFVMKYELDRHIDTQHKGLMYICCYCQTECRHVHTMMRHLRRRHMDRFEWQQNIRQFVDGLRQHVGEGRKAVKKQPPTVQPAVVQQRTVVAGPVTMEPQQSTLDMTQLGELLQSSDGSSEQPYIIAEVCQLGQDDAMNTHTVIMCSGAVDPDNLQQQLQTALESLAQEGENQDDLTGATMTIIGDISSADGQSVPVAYSESSLPDDQGCFIVPMKKTDSEKSEQQNVDGSAVQIGEHSFKSDANNIIEESSIISDNNIESEEKMATDSAIEQIVADNQVAMETTHNGIHDDVASGDIQVDLNNGQIIMEDNSHVAMDGTQVVVDDSEIVSNSNNIVISENNQIIIDDNNRVVMDSDNQVVLDSNHVIVNGNQVVIDNGHIVIDGQQVILDSGQIVVSGEQPFSEVIPSDSMDTIEQVVYGEYIV